MSNSQKKKLAAIEFNKNRDAEIIARKKYWEEVRNSPRVRNKKLDAFVILGAASGAWF